MRKYIDILNEALPKTQLPVAKPCPFCGSEAGWYKNREFEAWSVRCTECYCDFDCCATNEEAAIQQWNQRV